ncbi:MAG: sodium-translocating pyrophosphatase [Bacteroidetes bacterium]|jgi:K(+)-stimulated pyrophosphate-energized sodium pump|nr:sodium-translocating pyrophosphatase [Bacteroidota bacterium]
MTTIIIGAVLAIVALLTCAAVYMSVSNSDSGNDQMQKIANAISEGAMAFLGREYRTLAVFAIIIAALLWFFLGVWTAVCYAIGATLSATAGFIGMRAATKGNVRTAAAAGSSLAGALKIAFRSGAVMGLAVVGLGLLGLTSLLYIGTSTIGLDEIILALFGFSFGASTIALFSRVGGGIYTKAADVGADIVGKVEQGIPEDDPRNPATIADNVGDNVGDIAGMGADLYSSYVGSMIAAMALGLVLTTEHVYFPVALSSLGIVASLAGMLLVRADTEAALQKTLRNSFLFSVVVVLIGSWFLADFYFESSSLFWVVLAGLGAGVIIELATEFYTSSHFRPVKRLAESCETGAATNIIEGLGLGFMSTVVPMLVIIAVAFVSYTLSGFYGIAIAAVAMLSTLGISLAIDAYGPVADNAGGIAEMAGLPDEVRERTDALDAAGNMTAAIGKGFAIGSAGLTALAFFSAFATRAELDVISLLNINVLTGMFLGVLMPFVFTSLTMTAVSRAAFEMIEEVRRQFKEMPGILKGEVEPDYRRCVDISTVGALKQMIVPGLLIIIPPIIVGLVLGTESLGGMMIGALGTAMMLGIALSNAGGAWDNAKKFIETGEHGGKGSDAHAASVIGDTVGDPAKDTSGPSLNILIKLMSIVALTLLPLFL